jgi:hypothetical protein
MSVARDKIPGLFFISEQRNPEISSENTVHKSPVSLWKRLISPGKWPVFPGKIAILSGKIVVLPGKITVLPGKIAVLPGKIAVLPGKIAVLPGKIAILSGKIADFSGENCRFFRKKLPIFPEKYLEYYQETGNKSSITNLQQCLRRALAPCFRLPSVLTDGLLAGRKSALLHFILHAVSFYA